MIKSSPISDDRDSCMSVLQYVPDSDEEALQSDAISVNPKLQTEPKGIYITCHFVNDSNKIAIFETRFNPIAYSSGKISKIVKKRKVENDSKIKCKKCSEFFDSKVELAYHRMYSHVKGKPLERICYLCKTTPKNKLSLREHFDAMHTGQKPYKCRYSGCSKAFAAKANLSRHTFSWHIKDDTFRCTRCPKNYRRKYNLTAHMANKHSNGISYCCYLCKRWLFDTKRLHRHMNLFHNGQSLLRCPLPWCRQAFADKGRLRHHLTAIHTKGTVYKCTKCSDEFYYKRLLSKHMMNKHDLRINFRCYLCKESHGCKEQLRDHLKSAHRGFKPFKCQHPGCLKEYTGRTALKLHTNIIHTKAIEFNCTKCPKIFYQNRSLLRHLANKHGQGDVYHCYLCKKSLTSEQSLHRHMKSIHVGLKPFKCTECLRAFAQKPNLQRHMSVIHTMGKSIQCPECTKMFYYQKHLRQHLLIIHKRQPIPFTQYLLILK